MFAHVGTGRATRKPNPMLYEAIQKEVKDWFGGSSAPATPSDGSAAPANSNLGPVGTASVEASWNLFGGLFGGDDKKESDSDQLKAALKDAREQIGIDLAKDALKDKFKVGEGTGPNAVSKEEFEKIAKLYSDINAGRTDIKFDMSGVDKDQRAEMHGKSMEDIAKMLQTPAGRKLIGDLADNETKDPNDATKMLHHSTTIRPTDDKTVENDCDEKGMDAARAVRDKEAGDAIEKKSSTPGVGTDAIITYHPGVEKILDGPNVKATGDTTLFHEMVHADHMTHGTKVDSSQVVNNPGDRDNGTKVEEMATVGLMPARAGNDPLLNENEYRRERAAMNEDMPQRPSYK